jgi:hypothetical protein
MTKNRKLRKRDLEQISAYLDRELKDRDLQRFEARLVEDSSLQTALKEMADTKHLLRQLPQVRPPKHFILSPEMVGQKPALNLFPVFRFATVIATALFAVLVGTDAFLLSGSAVPQSSSVEERLGETAFDQVSPSAEMPAEELAAAAEEPLMDESPAEGAEAEALPEQAIGLAETPTEDLARETGERPGPGFLTQSPAIQASEEVTPTPSEASFTPTATSTVKPQSDDTATVPPEPPAPGPTEASVEMPTSSGEIGPLRIAEIAFGGAALLLAVATFLLRRAD